MSLETRVGAFVLLALVVLVGLVLALGDFRLLPGYELWVDFGYAGTLQAGAPVKVGGVRVGYVTSLDLLSPKANPSPSRPLGELGMSDRPIIRAHLVLEPELRKIVQ